MLPRLLTTSLRRTTRIIIPPPTASFLILHRKMSSAPKIQLTKTEEKFLSLLQEFAQEGRKLITPPIPEVECRIAGGWVRDKLLSLPSSDLDVTLSSISGYDFATAFVTYLSFLDPPIDTRTIGKVAANPDQSKHLETAATQILGLDLDFVALRSETYADGSRIPSEVRMGTPEEDALRRDITINTLFYNVHTREIEDWTGKGLADLASKTIRTPLPPTQTFQDDPLRILRCVRFASRFGYKLVEELEESLKDEEILESLRTRISRERVGIEIEKMLKGPNPLYSIQLITTLGLYPQIFTIPKTYPPPPASSPAELALKASHLFASLSPGGEMHHLVPPVLFEEISSKGKSKEKELWLACCLIPFRGGMFKLKTRDVTMAEMVVREGLKHGNSDVNAIVKFFASCEKLASPSIDYPSETIRSSIGNLLKDPSVHDPPAMSWSTSVLFSLLVELLGVAESSGLQSESKAVLQKYSTFVKKITELGLPAAIDEKPILDGKEINALLGLRPSAFTRTLLLQVISWQLDHPGASSEDCRQWLLKEKEEGKIVEPVVIPAAKPAKGKHQDMPENGGKKLKK